MADDFGLVPGDKVEVNVDGRKLTLNISGIVHTWGMKDYIAFLKLELLHKLTGKENKVNIAEVSALTKPKDKLALKAGRFGPDSLSPREFEKWYCSPYVNSIPYNIEEVIGGIEAKEIRKFSSLQEGILRELSVIFAGLAAVGFFICTVSMTTAAKMYLEERRREIGILKAIGPNNDRIISQLLAEMFIAAILVSGLGYWLSLQLARYLGKVVFSPEFQMGSALFLIGFVVSILLNGLTAFFLRNQINNLDPVELIDQR